MKLNFLIITVLLISCRKEESTNYLANLKNNTNHLIIIKPYSNGQIVNANVINLSSFQEFQIAKGFDRGLNGNTGFRSKYFANCDSIRIIYDNLYTITHYINTPLLLNNKYCLYSSNRNIFNAVNYAFSQKQLSKYQLENTYNFEFKEQDYLDAKP